MYKNLYGRGVFDSVYQSEINVCNSALHGPLFYRPDKATKI